MKTGISICNILLGAVVVLTSSSGMAAPGALLGSPFAPYPAQSQTDDSHTGVRVAASGNGFVVGWNLSHSIDGPFEIYLRRYDAQGQPVSDYPDLSIGPDQNQFLAGLAGNTEGRFVVLTQARKSNAAIRLGVRSQAFESGTLSAAVSVSDDSENTINGTDVDINAAGYFIVGFSKAGPDHSHINIRRFDENSSPLESQDIAVNADSDGKSFNAAVALRGDDSFAVLWNNSIEHIVAPAPSLPALFNRYKSFVRTRMFGPVALPKRQAATVARAVRTGFLGQRVVKGRSIVPLPSGGYAVAWSSIGNLPASNAIHIQTYGTDGQASSFTRTVTRSRDYVQTPKLAQGANGQIAVVWNEYNPQEPANNGIYMRLYDMGLKSPGQITRVSPAPGDDSRYFIATSISALNNGNYVVGWTQGKTPDDVSPQVRVQLVTGH